VGLPPVADEGAPPEQAGESAGLGGRAPSSTNIVLVGVVYFFLKLIRYALWS